MSCLICTESYNKSSHKKIICQYCTFEACRTCCRTYILQNQVSKCMDNSCNKEWTRKFVVENFTQVWTNNEYTNMQEKVIFDKEKALMPSTMPIVENKIKEEKYRTIIKNYQKEIKALEDEYWQKRNQISSNIHIHEMLLDEVTSNKTSSKNNYNARVCSKESCKGYLNDNWLCGLCETYTCSKCNTNIDGNIDNHICNKEDVETFSLLKKDTKACPKCNTNIYKIDGCDQMWCTQCHTAFSWRTGNIETKIHNPHYYDYYRQNGQNIPVQEVECGRGIEGVAGTALLNSIVNNVKEIKYVIFKEIQVNIMTLFSQFETKDIDNLMNHEFKRYTPVRRIQMKRILEYNSLNKHHALNDLYKNLIKHAKLSNTCIEKLCKWLPEFNNERNINEYNNILFEIERINTLYSKIKNNYNSLTNVFKCIIDLQLREIHNYRPNNDNTSLRVDYIMNKIDETTFKKHIQDNNKKYEKNNDITNICQVLITTFIDIIYRLENDLCNARKEEYNDFKPFNQIFVDHLQEIINIQKYCEQLLLENKKTYGGMLKKISFDIHHNMNTLNTKGTRTIYIDH